MEQTTFQKQLSTFAFNQQSILSIDDSDADKQRYSFIQRYSDKADEARILNKLQDMQKRGNSVLTKLTKVFGTNRGSIGGSIVDAKQLLREAEADQRFKKLKRNSRIIIQITKDNVAVFTEIYITSRISSAWILGCIHDVIGMLLCHGNTNKYII